MRQALIAAALAVAGAFVGCKCEEPSPAASASPASAGPAADPTRPPVSGWFCVGEGARRDPPEGAFRAGPIFVERAPNWEEVPADATRVLTVPGVRDVMRGVEDGAWMVRHRLPGSELFAVLSAKPHDFPPGTTFDPAGAQKVFDEVAANPRAILLGTRALTWGGRPAVEGAVKAESPGGITVVHHLVVQVEKEKGLDVVFLASEAEYHRYLAESCDAVGVAR